MTDSFHFLASTVLFVDSQPIGYKVYHAEDEFLLEPTDIPDHTIQPPPIKVLHKMDTWTVSGTLNQDLIDQVIEDISGMVVPVV